MKDVKTTVIGSYPSDINKMQIVKSYFNQENFSWKGIIESAVFDMINAGIDIVSDGQTRDPFVNIFTRKLQGCRIRDRTEIIDKVEYIDPITVKDQQFVRNLIPNEKMLLGLITGPYTLTKSSVDNFYHNEKELAYDFAKALRKEAENLSSFVDILSIDEPFFSMGVPDYGKDLISIVSDGLSCPVRLHCCGDISEVIPNLIDMPVDILSHEFKAQPKLFDAFMQYDIRKDICLGCVRSDNVVVESVDEIIEHIKKGMDIFGDRITQLAPDCGQRMLPRNIALEKLKNLVAAGEIVYGR
jgi:5-methyltetrahydropteroyltriglutamate--homocysteine methyltransferase